MSKLLSYKVVAPSHWASYLINGDDSGLEPDEKTACDAWLKWEGVGLPVSCGDAGFRYRHDAFAQFPFAADCQTYVFLVKGESDNALAMG